MKKGGTYEVYKNKKAEQEKARREQVVFENRIKSRKRVRKCRESKKQARLNEVRGVNTNQSVLMTTTSTSSLTHSYKTKSGLAKAVSKTKRTLPSSPSKRKIVVAKLLVSLDTEDKDEIIRNKTSKPQKTHWKRISPVLIQTIESFYERDEISVISPNVKDCRRFADPVTGRKELRQIRYLTYNLKKVHSLFVEDYRGT